MFSSTMGLIARRSRQLAGGIVLFAGLWTAGIPTAQATTWGHMRSPFSTESQQRERADFAAEERAIRSRGGWMAEACERYRSKVQFIRARSDKL